jgi:hypothetical protein
MKCQQKTKDGKACQIPAMKGSKYCFTHNPATRQAQAEARKMGGYNSHIPHGPINPDVIPDEINTISDAGQILHYVLGELIVMDNSVPRNRALISVAAGYIDAIKTGEIETQLKELLAVLQTRETKQ